MSDVSDLLGGKFLSSENVQQPLVGTIAGADRIEMDGQMRLALRFEELTKPLIANKTNLGTLVSLFGRDTAQWKGRQVVLQSEPVPFQGKMVNGLRVKPYQQPVQPVRPAQVAAAPAGPQPGPQAAPAVRATPAQQAEAIVPPDLHEQPPVDEIPF